VGLRSKSYRYNKPYQNPAKMGREYLNRYNMKTPTVTEFLSFIDELESKEKSNPLRSLEAIAQLRFFRKGVEMFEYGYVAAINVHIIKPEPQIFDLLGLPFEGSQLKEFSFPLLRERYQGQIEDSVMVRVIFIH
jgi:hypothetical protein